MHGLTGAISTHEDAATRRDLPAVAMHNQFLTTILQAIVAAVHPVSGLDKAVNLHLGL
jgi:hypothetical protein